LYTCVKEEPCILISNLVRILSHDKTSDVLMINDSNQNKDVLLSSPKLPDEESDDEDYKKAYDLLFSKDPKITYLNLFNFRANMMHSYQILY
jgi:hypothetical protein